MEKLLQLLKAIAGMYADGRVMPEDLAWYMDIAALIIQADKKARDGMWLVLSISTDSLTIRILPADF